MSSNDTGVPKSSIELGSDVGTKHMKGWPYTDFATGWYQVGYSAEIQNGEMKAAKWLNQDLAFFRTESGVLSVLDAYCPHMGAHLAKPGRFGGKVCGEAIQCPWHGWQWDADGNNVSIPYRPESPSKAKAEKKHVRETDGCIVMWYDHAGEPPTYEWEGLPYRGPKESYYPITFTFDGPHLTKPQMPFENSADPHHFPHVHGSAFDAEFGEHWIDGPRAVNTMNLMFGGDKEDTWMTPNGPVMGSVDTFLWGASIGVARFNIEDMVCVHMNNFTPVDHDYSMFFSTTTATKEPGDTGDEPKGRSGQMMAAQHWQIRNDVHIWENMKYMVRPKFTGKAEQTRYAGLRRHLDQFYPNPVYKANEEIEDLEEA
jgi:3-ketosteroid 9alpha-monooxygenase subunit A